MSKLENQISKIVEDKICTKATFVVGNVKIRFTEKNVNLYTFDNNCGWFKELTIDSNVYNWQIAQYIVNFIKLNK